MMTALVAQKYHPMTAHIADLSHRTISQYAIIQFNTPCKCIAHANRIESSLYRDHSRTWVLSTLTFQAGTSVEMSDDGCQKARKKSLSDKEYDPITFHVLKVKAEDLANQITLIDLPVFKSVTPEELSTGAWTKKNKRTIAPNVMNFTDRFNSVCLWCQREILSCEKPSKRAEVLVHFIKVAKQLYELNNLHSTFAIVSALQSHPIHRLSKTWNLVSRHDRSAFDKIARVFDSERNWERLRQHIDSMKLPCIPYLGMFLTDLNFIGVATKGHENSFLEGHTKDQKVNNVIRTIAHFQDSLYDDVPHVDCIQEYLRSFQFHEELLKFVEDDMYRLSLKREHDADASTSRAGAIDFLRRSSFSRKLSSVPRIRLNRSTCEKSSHSHSLTPQLIHDPERAMPKTVLGHRKTRSLGAHATFGLSLKREHDADASTSRAGAIDFLRRSSFSRKLSSVPRIRLNRSTCEKSSHSHSLTPQLIHDPERAMPKTVLGHRKTRSLGAHATFGLENISFSLESGSCPSSASTVPSVQSPSGDAVDKDEMSQSIFYINDSEHNLLDGSSLSHDLECLLNISPSSALSISTPILDKTGSKTNGQSFVSPEPKNESDELQLIDDENIFPDLQGEVRKMVVRTRGSKPAKMKCSRKCYLELRGTNLYQFEKKALAIHCKDERGMYKRKTSKRMVIGESAWRVIKSGGVLEPAFELHHPSSGRIYRFLCKSQTAASEWYAKLLAAMHQGSPKTPANLISFD
ncbi:Ras-specific guanine nucleotide-releasing factor RalGPS2 [Toxocara canis]|uniref:Ras-specific guanine nucleotide-releasing factor RalGPS2 n=1 Tax=Toxocara canis TaxID=6265 RepID=A0A0B2VUS4_TOXCA|nr:Ras-specific guanine nucleotide-releasing factor RalGPS2 [Toxocara canis]